ncbi:hypothetical protein PR202_ga12733 [Eleusine coracana subsp. coracana]|uniref:Uncharacterized protein n=1 Tax=Eleusine coracana subsp. coracana TaxID=191504 RepID=A0AAV5CCT9_ELECO|nr:hypothetical protein PR202_ga12733 [Eleusine coracana subsp. coracana]
MSMSNFVASRSLSSLFEFLPPPIVAPSGEPLAIADLASVFPWPRRPRPCARLAEPRPEARSVNTAAPPRVCQEELTSSLELELD